MHRLARDRAARRPLKELFEGVEIGLPGVGRAHGIADQLLRPLDPVHAGLGHHQHQVSGQVILPLREAGEFPFPRRRSLAVSAFSALSPASVQKNATRRIIRFPN